MTDSERLLWASVFANGITATNAYSWRSDKKEMTRRAAQLADEVLEAVEQVLTDNLDWEESKILGLKKFMEG
ncbi:MAG: hypothetical protein ACTSW7_00795 [Candidatus Thorarchaeota archaeon]|nr:hypothetical protein [Thermoplasmatales archaeon]